MVMVEDLAHTAACAFGDFAGSLDGAHADVLARDGCAFSNIAGGVERVKRNQIARTFADTFGRGSSAFGCALANVSGTAANVTAGAALLRLGLRLGCWSGLRVLAKGVGAAEGKAQPEKREER
jgi:hypothetical protein